MKWYVVQCTTGREIDVRNEIQRQGLPAKVPREHRMIRCRGKWIYRDYTLFPGYVFVGSEDLTDAEYYIVKGIACVLRFLGVTTPQFLSDREAAYLDLLAPTDAPLEASVAEQGDDGSVHIVAGVLAQLDEYIERIDKHRRRVQVRVPMLQDNKVVEFSFTVPDKEQPHERTANP